MTSPPPLPHILHRKFRQRRKIKVDRGTRIIPLLACLLPAPGINLQIARDACKTYTHTHKLIFIHTHTYTENVFSHTHTRTGTGLSTKTWQKCLGCVSERCEHGPCERKRELNIKYQRRTTQWNILGHFMDTFGELKSNLQLDDDWRNPKKLLG